MMFRIPPPEFASAAQPGLEQLLSARPAPQVVHMIRDKKTAAAAAGGERI